MGKSEEETFGRAQPHILLSSVPPTGRRNQASISNSNAFRVCASLGNLLTMSPFLGQARPFCTNFPWFCRFLGPPSANLQSKGSEGASKRKHTQLLGHGAAPTPPVAPSPGPRGLTCYSRGRLYILSIKVGDDGFTLLCGLHPKTHMRSKATCPGYASYTYPVRKPRLLAP